MKFMELIRKRKSIRTYKNIAVPKDVLNRCAEAFRLAPSASNSQPWKLVIVDEPKLVKNIAKECWDPVVSFNKFVMSAAAFAVIIVEPVSFITQVGIYLQKREYPLIDIGIAAEHFCLQAAEDGLGTCILGWFKEKSIKKELNIPKNKHLGLVIACGYPENDDLTIITEKKRKDFDSVVLYNKYE